jgi:hypothetical protein
VSALAARDAVVSKSLHAFLHSLVDYAGLFPPAALPMDAAVANYAAYRRAPEAWVLGRFVVPVSRLGEMADAMRAAGEPGAAHPWHVSALVGEDLAGDLDAVRAFNAGAHGAFVDALEVKAGTVEAIRAVAARAPREMKTYVEIPSSADPRDLVVAIAAAKLRAKIRTGGVTAAAIPPVEDVARFLRACYSAGAAFKATAGLHHAVRGEHALTYEPGAPRAVMHGFLNVFLAAAFHYNGLTVRDTTDLLTAGSFDDVVFADDRLAWRDYVVTLTELSSVRRRLAVAFGSCSFREPVDELTSMGFLA